MHLLHHQIDCLHPTLGGESRAHILDGLTPLVEMSVSRWIKKYGIQERIGVEDGEKRLNWSEVEEEAAAVEHETDKMRGRSQD